MWPAVRPRWLGKVIRRSHDIFVKYVNISWEFYKNDQKESHKLLNFQISSKLQTRRFVICVLFSLSFSAAAAKLLQSCPTPQMEALQAPPSLGFSRQEHWSGLPFPSPMHESEKWKGNRSVVSDSSDPMDCSLPGSSVYGIF